MSMKTVEESWQQFAGMVLGPDVDPQSVQWNEMKKSFLAGTWSLMSSIEFIGDNQISDYTAAAFLDGIENECQEFYRKIYRDNVEKN